MSKLKYEHFALLLLAFCVPILFGCEEGPPGPAGQSEPARISVSALIQLSSYDTTSAKASVHVADCPSIPGAQIGGVDGQTLTTYSVGMFSFDFDFLALFPGDTAHLSVSFIKDDGSPGLAPSAIMIPGPFDLVSPQAAVTCSLSVGDSLAVTWSASAGADAYDIWFFLHYGYADTVGLNQWFYLFVDTLVTDTTMTFPEGDLFPNAAAVDSIFYDGGKFQVRAKSGPLFPGDLGNISGDGEGFFNAWSGHKSFPLLIRQP